MPDSDKSKIPVFYRFYFKLLDPAVLIWSTYMYFFTPAVVINAFVPLTVAPHNPYHDFLFHQIGGALLMLAIITFALLRYTHDINVWKIIETAILVYDFILLYTNYYSLAQQRRLKIGALRPEDWGNVVITSQAVVVRTLFLCGIGLSKNNKATKRS